MLTRIIILTGVLAVFACLGLYYGQVRPVTKAVLATAEDIPLYLDGSPTGSVNKIEPLVKQFRSLLLKVDTNANLPSGGLANVGNIVFSPSGNVSMNDLGRVWDNVKEFFEYPAFQRTALWNGNRCTEAGGDGPPTSETTFVLSTSPMSTDDLTRVKTGSQCWVKTQLYTDDSPSAYQRRFIKSNRTAYTSLEITERGSYLFNEQVKNAKYRVSPIANLSNPGLARKLDAAVVKQRNIDSASLDKEIEMWIKKRIEEGSENLVWDESESIVLPIIVNGRASYSAVFEILRFVNLPKTKLIIVIDDSPGR